MKDPHLRSASAAGSSLKISSVPITATVPASPEVLTTPPEADTVGSEIAIGASGAI